MNRILLIIILFFGTIINAQNTEFKTVGTYDQYVPVLFGFNNKPFSISRPSIHQDRDWLAYGTATISGIGYGWGAGNIKIKLENFTSGVKNSNNTGGRYSYIGRVSVEWASNGIIVYLRGNTTYYTDGIVKKNDGTYTANGGTQRVLSSVSLDEKGFNIPSGVYIADWDINPDTKSVDAGADLLSYKNGNVGIETNDPQNKLDVNGTIHSKEVKVDMEGWADYVFKKDYTLPTLQEVEQHIQEKGHLPNIPSEKEVVKNGLFLAENQKLLLQKIEELTLYIIELNKTVTIQNEKNIQLERKIEELDKTKNNN